MQCKYLRSTWNIDWFWYINKYHRGTRKMYTILSMFIVFVELKFQLILTCTPSSLDFVSCLHCHWWADVSACTPISQNCNSLVEKFKAFCYQAVHVINQGKNVKEDLYICRILCHSLMVRDCIEWKIKRLILLVINL